MHSVALPPFIGFRPISLTTALLAGRLIVPMTLSTVALLKVYEAFSRFSILKMLKNSVKAHQEHKGYSYISGADGREIRRRCSQPLGTPLSSNSVCYQHRGTRKHQEDRHFICQGEGYLLCGIFDGHGGAAVSQYASDRFASLFGGPYGSPEEVQAALYRAFSQLEAEIEKETKWNRIGSTATVCYLDLERGLIYTATLGDSEAKRYRGENVTPLSTVRNWKSPKDRAYFQRRVAHPQFQSEYPTYPFPNFPLPQGGWSTDRFFNDPNVDPKQIRLHGINLSRALGDAYAGLLHKPKIGIATIDLGDLILISSDGLIDQISEQDVVKILAMKSDLDQRTQILVLQSVYNSKKSDNVTVLAVRIHWRVSLPILQRA